MTLREAFEKEWAKPWPYPHEKGCVLYARLLFYAGAKFGTQAAQQALDEAFEEVSQELTHPFPTPRTEATNAEAQAEESGTREEGRNEKA